MTVDNLANLALLALAGVLVYYAGAIYGNRRARRVLEALATELVRQEARAMAEHEELLAIQRQLRGEQEVSRDRRPN